MRSSKFGWRSVAPCAALAIACAVTAPPDARAEEAGGGVEPSAMVALDNMGRYLQTLKSFQVSATIEGDDVLDNGLKVQHGVTIDALARRPNGLRVQTTSDRSQRQYYFDGKEFTLVAPRLGYYATVAAPPTIGELVDKLDEKFGIEFPLVDLFRWGTAQAPADGITAAMNLGTGSVDGTTCGHYAFRQEGLDWQIWIQKGDFPLPRKLLLTTTTDEARPQYEAVYTWNLAPSYSDSAFTFAPTASNYRITLNEQAQGASMMEARHD